MDLIINNYKEIIALIGSLTGLLGLIATIYYKFRDSNIKDKELEIKERQYDDNKKYQLSKEKYQELISKKIEMLEKISLILVQYDKDKSMINIPDGDVEHNGKWVDSTIKEEKLMIDTFRKIDNVLEKNQLLIANEIQEIYKQIKDSLLKQDAEYYDFRINGSNNDEEIQDAYADKDKIFYKQHKDELHKLLELLNQEIQKVRKEIQI
ncbi:hypothetical protein [Aliarcobacter butzleri]|uniref:hypothetical protein n=1 Tax=Aliarcobacter butzleri TaxID=28197 RepID=UPI00263D7E39|nr:hypothetical protein [Aliarcobacter butzleri]MDN5081976.1 hypothetical protein [Aliarcobacter butzleri]MDN5084286.1 hypothetical protein [Aliarcobacter butzleri]